MKKTACWGPNRRRSPVGQTLLWLSGVGRICFVGEKPQVLNHGRARITQSAGSLPPSLSRKLVRLSAGEGGGIEPRSLGSIQQARRPVAVYRDRPVRSL